MQATLTVRRWRRYGADRLFVVSPTGAPMGSVDLVSGDVDVTDPTDEPAVRRAAQEYLRADVAELALPTQRSGPDGLSAVDVDLLTAWLGEPATTTAGRLDQLGDRGWTVLRDVPLGPMGSACPYLLIGPAGVQTASDAGHADSRSALVGAVLHVDGVPTSAVRTAVLQARRVGDLLRAAAGVPFTVRAVLAVAGRLEGGLVRDDRPLVVGADDLVAHLLALPETLTPGAVSAIARAARRPDTWAGER